MAAFRQLSGTSAVLEERKEKANIMSNQKILIKTIERQEAKDSAEKVNIQSS